MLQIGETSGCLTIISNDFKANYEIILSQISSLAKKEWLRFDNWYSDSSHIMSGTNNFISYYGLNKKEATLFKSKSDMPDSFIKKYYHKKIDEPYWKLISQLQHILYHSKHPNTEYEFITALKKKELYQVKCSICGQIYLIDEIRFKCVKWTSCSGEKCLAHTINSEKDYSNNLCSINKQSLISLKLKNQLCQVENLSTPLPFYGGYPDLHISYIYDLHLLHHLPKDSSLNSFILSTVKRLYETMDSEGIILFGGDISSDAQLTVSFLRKFIQYSDYQHYQSIKEKLLQIQNEKMSFQSEKDRLEKKIEKINKNILSILTKLEGQIDFLKIKQFKNRWHPTEKWAETIQLYEANHPSVSHPQNYGSNLSELSNWLDILEVTKTNLECLVSKNEHNNSELIELKINEDKDIQSIRLYKVYQHQKITNYRGIFMVLGNHEYIGFNSLNEARTYYSRELKYLNIHLLDNTGFRFEPGDSKYCILGGTGFAKYNLKYNADSLLCCSNFTREEEIQESSKFEKLYSDVKKYAKEHDYCFICVTHYPVTDWSKTIDKDTIYFYGHNHQNYYRRNENETIYADNQIGYNNNNIGFKIAKIGSIPNPYSFLQDGVYKTSIEDYMLFNRFIGENVSGSLLYKRCQDDKASIYVVKRMGYYGFFIVDKNEGWSKGISIVNGGKTKKITESTDLQWVFDNFEIVLSRYLELLTPFRKLQDHLSKELIELGFSGKIHGCIIDIDFYHHIMINPVDKTITLYYSPEFGLVKRLSSFKEVLKSIEENSSFPHELETGSILNRYLQNSENPNYLLGQLNKEHLIGQNDKALSEDHEELEIVSESEGMYGMSRKINPLQRLFSGHVLRAFDLRLTDSKPKNEHQKSINSKKLTTK